MRILTFLVGTCSLLWCPLSAGAQGVGIARSFEQLQLLVRAGDSVTVVDATGAEVSGRIQNLSDSSLTLQTGAATRDWLESDVRLVRQRRGDSLSNGAVWGLGAGVVTGAALAATLCESCSAGDITVGVLVYGAMGVGVGIGVDALIARRQVIYQRPGTAGVRLMPFTTPNRRGMLLSLSF